MVARRIQIWSVPNDSAGFRLLAEPPVLSVSTMDRAADEAPGTGSITIPGDWEYLSLALEIDPSDIAGSAASGLIVVSQLLPNPDSGSGEPAFVWTPVFEFFADAASEKITDEGPVVVVSGPEIRSGLDDGVVYPKSTFEPHYQWGAPTVTANADLSESAVRNEEISVWVLPDGASDPSGTWSLTINGQNTGNLDWDATPAEIKTAIDAAVTTITEALVSGAGTVDDPWKILLVDDPPANQSIVSGSSLVDGELRLRTDVEGGNAFPNYWQKSQTYEGEVFGVHGGASMNVVDDPAGGGGKALVIVGNSAFIGAQQIIDVEPASTGYASVELYTSSSVDEFRLVLRTLDGGFVASTGGSGGYEGQTVTPDTWTTLEIPSIQLLEEHGDRLILRIAVVSEGNPTDFYLRNLEYHPGLPGTTAGDISQILGDAAAGRGALDWIDYSTAYDDETDAAGEYWDEDALAFQADAGEKLGTHVHGDLQQMGYELDLVRIPDDELASGSGVIPTHYLELYNPGGRGPAASLNTAIVVGAGIGGGTVEKRRVPFTHLLLETYDGTFVSGVTDARLAGLPRREAFLRVEQARDAATATKIGEAVLDAMIENLFATQVVLVGDTVVAYRDFDIGSTVPYTLGASRAGRHDRRVNSIAMRFDGDVWTDTITASKVFPDETSPSAGADSPLVLEALRKLYARFDRRRISDGRRGGGGGALIQAPKPEAGTTGAFTHLERLASQTIAVSGEAVDWDTFGAQGQLGFAGQTVGTEIEIPKAGYWNVGILLGWDTYTSGGSVWVTRTRAGAETTVWPPTGDPGLWTTGSGETFEGEAKALPLRVGDIVKVYVDHDDASTHDLATAAVAVYLVDRAGDETVSYESVVLADEPLAYWRLDELSGDALDSSGNGYDATLNGSPNRGEAGVMNDATVHYSVDGWSTSNYFDRDDAASADFEFPGTESFSVEAWVTNISGGLSQIVGVGRGSSTSGQYDGWSLAASESAGVSTIEFGRGRRSGGFVEQYVSAGGYTPADRLHAVVTYDGTDLLLYVNGQLADSDSTAVSIDDSIVKALHIGVGNLNLSPQLPFSGRIDEVAIYSSVLSPVKIAYHYQIGVQGGPA